MSEVYGVPREMCKIFGDGDGVRIRGANGAGLARVAIAFQSTDAKKWWDFNSVIFRRFKGLTSRTLMTDCERKRTRAKDENGNAPVPIAPLRFRPVHQVRSVVRSVRREHQMETATGKLQIMSRPL